MTQCNCTNSADIDARGATDFIHTVELHLSYLAGSAFDTGPVPQFCAYLQCRARECKSHRFTPTMFVKPCAFVLVRKVVAWPTVSRIVPKYDGSQHRIVFIFSPAAVRIW